MHDNVIGIIERFCIPVLVRLELAEKAGFLRNEVLDKTKAGDYGTALEKLRDFVLADPAMYKLFPQLVDNAEPGLDVLNKFAGEFGIP